ncbi:hypothetical protein Tco_0841593 [Tanacetum coccineum]|uniref:Uncharacterized protein n=1 Tax=Tanacetum coccineum TaxID=301880 RepID=A0ABQ5AWT6_9ASTR
MTSSMVTYTFVYSDIEPWRFQWVSDDELEASQSPGHAPPYPEYVPGPEHPPLPDYVPSPEEPEQAPLLPNYVPEPEYPEYLEDPVEDLAEYPADGGDDDDDDDDGDDDVNKEDEEEEEEHLAPADSTTLHIVDIVSSAGDTKTLMAASVEALIAEYAAVPTPPSPPPSPLTLLSSLPPRFPYYDYHYHHHLPILAQPIDDLPEADMPLRKRACFTAPIGRFEVEESSLTAAARQAGHTLAHRIDYGFIDTIDASICASESRAMIVIREVNEGVTNLATTQRQETYELQRQRIRDEDKLMSHIQHEHDRFRELVRTTEVGPQDGPVNAGSSSILYCMLSIMGNSQLALP